MHSFCIAALYVILNNEFTPILLLATIIVASKIHPVEADKCRQTDKMKLIGTFCDYVNVPKTDINFSLHHNHTKLRY
jgi:hypothetical protein